MTIVGQASVMYFSTVFVIFHKNIAQILQKLEDFTTFGRPPNFEKRNRQISFVSKSYRALTVFGTIFIISYSVLSTKECEDSNKTKIQKDICGMVAPIWLPIAFDRFPTKQFVIMWQGLCALINFASASAATSAILEIMENCILRFQHLKHLILVIVKVPKSQIRSQLFVKWVQYHVFVTKYDYFFFVKTSIFIHMF